MVLGSVFPEKATVGQQYPGVIRTRLTDHAEARGKILPTLALQSLLNLDA